MYDMYVNMCSVKYLQKFTENIAAL